MIKGQEGYLFLVLLLEQFIQKCILQYYDTAKILLLNYDLLIKNKKSWVRFIIARDV